MTINFSAPLNRYLTLSDKKSALFVRAGVTTLGELLLHLPIRYEDRSHITPIADLIDGQMAQVFAQVIQSRVTFARRRMLHVTLADSAGRQLLLRYFQFYPNQQHQFKPGRWGLFYAKAQLGSQGMEFHHPNIQWLNSDEYPKLEEKLLAVYPTVSRLNQKDWRTAINKALTLLKEQRLAKDPLLAEGYISFPKALETLHQPTQDQSISLLESREHPARQRLIIEELCAHQLLIAQARLQRATLKAPSITAEQKKYTALIESFPFRLTNAQQRVVDEIKEDLQKNQPMMRLVQGDVGSGKTIIALLAALQVIWSGRQAVLMVPTELLAEQHAQNINKLLIAENINCSVLVSKMPAAKKRDLLQRIAQGEVNFIIGTHAVFQQQVSYHDLALIIIDEQHRFGVHQRLMLQDKSSHGHGIHQLVLTATPIPRTLAMSHYGELDVSVIDELPKGRKQIQTSVINQDKRNEVIERVGENCRQGGQAYWVCPLIEESEVLECENAEVTATSIQAALTDIKVGLVHGRLSQSERQQTMQAFTNSDIQLLVATTVIEVGVDVANATLMIIENAERFGLAQLHQLRGRVGRGAAQAYCVLMYQSPLTMVAKRRLQVMRSTNDGFVIAEEDLAIRGAGELLGTRQTGAKLFKIADLERDQALLPQVNHYCQRWVATEPQFVEALLSRWLVGHERYLQV